MLLRLAELIGFPCPPMPAAALPWEVKAALGKAAVLAYWKDLYVDGLEVGVLIGLAGESIVLLLLGFAALMVYLLVRAVRGGRR